LPKGVIECGEWYKVAVRYVINDDRIESGELLESQRHAEYIYKTASAHCKRCQSTALALRITRSLCLMPIMGQSCTGSNWEGFLVPLEKTLHGRFLCVVAVGDQAADL